MKRVDRSTKGQKEDKKDAMDFSQKSHQVKHWMNTQPEEDTQPPFKIKIKVQGLPLQADRRGTKNILQQRPAA